MQSLAVVRKGGRIPRRGRSFARSGPLLGRSPEFDGSVRPWRVHDPQRIPFPPLSSLSSLSKEETGPKEQCTPPTIEVQYGRWTVNEIANGSGTVSEVQEGRD